MMPLKIKNKKVAKQPLAAEGEEAKQSDVDDFERDLSRNMHMQGERKIKWADISFESEAHNIFDPFYSS